ncbi:stage V sporulation protein R [Paenibacillus stellifer]|uniref:Stage V sporulation protein R n=1 Tax=Paenibacillus stellifer TaxID=169760 RepID=A0A089N023_9BACL|nr:SpoVR family protein [Paenibacillus stellifer]AIQ62009.1 stage V sporulation protein R [Paenibacillus stellifer]
MLEQDAQQLEQAADRLTELALASGLDFFPMRYQVCPAEVLYSIGAYGMPTRFAHWSFGKAYQRMKMEYDHGLSKIYELVINSDPCYAFLLDSNTLLQNKLIVAHVLGHSDFFKNNAMFAGTDRKMVDRMAVFADRIESFSHDYGADEVEAFLDAGIAIQEHVDPFVRFGTSDGFRENDGGIKDVIGYIAGNSRYLEEWQREILYMLRAEMLYFWPQMETKIMNEGWASYWHLKLVRELELSDSEIVEFAKMNAGVIQPSPGSINPYYLGLMMLRHIEKKQGQDALFEIREIESDVSFIRNYLTKELAEEMDLFVFKREDSVYRVTAKDVDEIKDNLIRSRTNGGFPYLTVKDDDLHGRGELLIDNRFEGLELDRKYVERTLPMVYRLWGRSVHLRTVVDGQEKTYVYDGKQLAG